MLFCCTIALVCHVVIDLCFVSLCVWFVYLVLLGGCFGLSLCGMVSCDSGRLRGCCC